MSWPESPPSSAIIGLGFLLAQLDILDATEQRVLTRMVFYRVSPALMIIVLGEQQALGPAWIARQTG